MKNEFAIEKQIIQEGIRLKRSRSMKGEAKERVG